MNLRQSRLVKPSRHPLLFPEETNLVKATLASMAIGWVIAFLIYVLVSVFH